MAEMDFGAQQWSNSASFTHDPGTTNPICGVVVLIASRTATDVVSGVTYGGVAMTRVEHVVGGESTGTWAYHLGDASAIPSGPQTVVVSGISGTFSVAVYTIQGTVDTEIVDFGSSIVFEANPSIALTHGGRLCYDFDIYQSGTPGGFADGVQQSGMVWTGSRDSGGGSTGWQAAYRPAGTADTTVGWNFGTADDVSHIGLAVGQVVAGSPFTATADAEVSIGAPFSVTADAQTGIYPTGVLLFDSFTKPDNTVLNGTSPDHGAQLSIWFDGPADITIQGGKVASASEFVSSHVNPDHEDAYWQTEMSAFSEAVDTRLELDFRWNGSPDRWIAFVYRSADGGFRQVGLVKVVAGAATEVWTADPGPIDPAGTHIMRAEAIGDNISVLWDGVQIGETITDTANNFNTSAGIGFANGGGGRHDNFEAGTLTGLTFRARADASATVTASASLSATADASATVTADYTDTADASATVTADFSETGDASATITADLTETADAQVSVQNGLTARGDLSATVTASFTGTADAEATVTADLTARGDASLTVTAETSYVTTADASATITATVSETADASATVTESLVAGGDVGATVTARLREAGDLSAIVTADYQRTADAEAHVLNGLTFYADIEATVTADFRATADMSATLSADFTAIADASANVGAAFEDTADAEVSVQNGLTVTADMSATVTATLVETADLAATITATYTARSDAEVGVHAVYSKEADVEATVAAGLVARGDARATIEQPFAATADASAIVTADLRQTADAEAHIRNGVTFYADAELTVFNFEARGDVRLLVRPDYGRALTPRGPGFTGRTGFTPRGPGFTARRNPFTRRS